MHDGSRIGLVLHPRRDCAGAATQVAAWTSTHDVELVATAEGNGGRHQVACLLPPQTRRALWAELQQGATPDGALERVDVPEEAVDVEAAEAGTTIEADPEAAR